MSSWANEDVFGRRTRPEGGDIDFTPLIDVVFLLLIFFMYSAAMSSQQSLDMPAARHGAGVDPAECTVVTIHADDVAGAEPKFVLGDGDQPKGTLADVRPYIEAGRQEGKTNVMIKAERVVPHRFVLEVARLVSETDSGNVVIAVEEAPP